MDIVTYALLKKKIEEGGGGKLPESVVGSQAVTKIIDVPLPNQHGALIPKNIIINTDLSIDEVNKIIEEAWPYSVSMEEQACLIGLDDNSEPVFVIMIWPWKEWEIPGATDKDYGLVIQDNTHAILLFSSMPIPEGRLMFGEVKLGWQQTIPQSIDTTSIKTFMFFNTTELGLSENINPKIVDVLAPIFNLGKGEAPELPTLYNYKDGVLDTTNPVYPKTIRSSLYEDDGVTLLEGVGSQMTKDKEIPLPNKDGALIPDNIIFNTDLPADKVNQIIQQALPYGFQADDLILLASWAGSNLVALQYLNWLDYSIPNATVDDYALAIASMETSTLQVLFSTLTFQDEFFGNVQQGWQSNAADIVRTQLGNTNIIFDLSSWGEQETIDPIMVDILAPIINLGIEPGKPILYNYSNGQLDLSNPIYPITSVNNIVDANNNPNHLINYQPRYNYTGTLPSEGSINKLYINKNMSFNDVLNWCQVNFSKIPEHILYKIQNHSASFEINNNAGFYVLLYSENIYQGQSIILWSEKEYPAAEINFIGWNPQINQLFGENYTVDPWVAQNLTPALLKNISAIISAEPFIANEIEDNKVALETAITNKVIYPKTIKAQLFEDDGTTPLQIGSKPRIILNEETPTLTTEQLNIINSTQGRCEVEVQSGLPVTYTYASSLFGVHQYYAQLSVFDTDLMLLTINPQDGTWKTRGTTLPEHLGVDNNSNLCFVDNDGMPLNNSLIFTKTINGESIFDQNSLENKDIKLATPLDLAEKVDLATYAVSATGLVQADAATIIQHPELYEGKIIQFYSNDAEPRYLISYGVLIRDTTPEHKLCLIELDRNGHTIRWTAETNYNANEGITFREI